MRRIDNCDSRVSHLRLFGPRLVYFNLFWVKNSVFLISVKSSSQLDPSHKYTGTDFRGRSGERKMGGEGKEFYTGLFCTEAKKSQNKQIRGIGYSIDCLSNL